jgi:hypothetical protein
MHQIHQSPQLSVNNCCSAVSNMVTDDGNITANRGFGGAGIVSGEDKL